jgi:hypothetical protein
MAYDILPRLPAMARNMGDLEDELSRIYQLVNDLSGMSKLTEQN